MAIEDMTLMKMAINIGLVFCVAGLFASAGYFLSIGVPLLAAIAFVGAASTIGMILTAPWNRSVAMTPSLNDDE